MRLVRQVISLTSDAQNRQITGDFEPVGRIVAAEERFMSGWYLILWCEEESP